MKQCPSILLLPLLCLSALPQLGAQTPAEIRQSNSNSSNSDFSHTRQLVQEGKYDEAIAELQQLSITHPGLKGLPHELGMAHYSKGDYLRAVNSFKQALQQDSADNEATQMLG